MAIHDNFAALAKKLIAKNGRPVTVKTTTRTPSDPAKPWDGDSESVSTTGAPAVFLDPDASTTFGDLMIQLTQGLTQEERDSLTGARTTCWIAAQAVPNGITPADTIVDGNTEWEIRSVKKLQPGPTVVAYVLEVTR